MKVKVTFRGFDYNPAGAARQVGPILRRVHRSLTRQIATDARGRVPVLTGHLGRSIREDPQRQTSPFRVSGGVTAHAKYARFVHDGTRPHVIRARNVRALRFTVGGKTLFRSAVNHPGTGSRPFLRNAGAAVVARDRRISTT